MPSLKRECLKELIICKRMCLPNKSKLHRHLENLAKLKIIHLQPNCKHITKNYMKHEEISRKLFILAIVWLSMKSSIYLKKNLLKKANYIIKLEKKKQKRLHLIKKSKIILRNLKMCMIKQERS